ncbi:MAG: opioid growth factor receptor-related protein [Stenomitos frigidus ULC029]
MTNSQLVNFYLGQCLDTEGRKIESIWAWDDVQLEDVHNYIQWLFPLIDQSRFNPDAPLLTAIDIQTFNASSDLKQRVLMSFKRMLQFYGLQSAEDNDAISITTAETFSEQRENWLNWGNHNHLRITRILTSLRLLGLDAYAQAFFQCLTQLYKTAPNEIDPRSYAYWQDAVSKTLYPSA